jgi:hypothetical protein
MQIEKDKHSLGTMSFQVTGAMAAEIVSEMILDWTTEVLSQYNFNVSTSPSISEGFWGPVFLVSSECLEPNEKGPEVGNWPFSSTYCEG